MHIWWGGGLGMSLLRAGEVRMSWCKFEVLSVVGLGFRVVRVLEGQGFGGW